MTDSLKAVVRTMRPHQWVKNVFVLAPLFFAQAFWEVENVVLALLAALFFSLIAGTVYLINDIVDCERDRLHPTKRFRPIAAGDLDVGTAKVVAFAVGITTLAAAAFVSPVVAAILVTYLVMNLAYSKILKAYAFVDVGIIAVGFVLRVAAGGFAIGVFLSEWLIACTFLLACFLGFGKRLHEMHLCESGQLEKIRDGWAGVQSQALEVALFVSGGLTLTAYTIYTLTAALPDQPFRAELTPFTSPYLPVTIPLVVVGLGRFYQLARRDTAVSPTEQMLRDPVVLGTVLVWGGVLGALVVL